MFHTNFDFRRNQRKSLALKAAASASSASASSAKPKRSNVGSDTASVASATDSRSSTPVHMDQKGPMPKMGKRDSIKSDTLEGSEPSSKRKRSELVETVKIIVYFYSNFMTFFT